VASARPSLGPLRGDSSVAAAAFQVVAWSLVSSPAFDRVIRWR